MQKLCLGLAKHRLMTFLIIFCTAKIGAIVSRLLKSEASQWWELENLGSTNLLEILSGPVVPKWMLVKRIDLLQRKLAISTNKKRLKSIKFERNIRYFRLLIPTLGRKKICKKCPWSEKLNIKNCWIHKWWDKGLWAQNIELNAK